MSQRKSTSMIKAMMETSKISSSIIQLAQDAIVVIDENQKIIYFNQSAENIFGYDAAEIAGQSLEILLPEAFSAVHQIYIRSFAQSPEQGRSMGERKEISGRRKNGTIFPAEASIAKVSEGGKVFFTAILRDVTERKIVERALRESEKKQSLVLNGVDEIIYQVNYPEGGSANGTVEFVSERTQEILGFRPTDFIADPNRWFNLIHPEDIPAVQAQTTKIFTTGQPGLRHYRMKDTNGEYRWMEDRVSPQKDKTGRVVRTFGVARDGTERYQAEQNLRQSEAFSRAVLDSLSAHICVLNAQGKITAVNKAWEDFSRENSGNQKTMQYVGVNYLTEIENAIQKGDESAQTALDGITAVMNGTREIFDLEYPCHAPGEQRWFVMRVRPLSDGSGEVVVSHQTITERKLAELARQNSEKLYREMVENASDIIYSVDLNGKFTHSNEAGIQAIGYSLDELRQRSYLDVILPEYRRKVQTTYFRQYLEKQPTTDVEFPFLTKSGEVCWFSQNASPIMENGSIVGFHVIARDITERKQMEEQLQRSEARYRAIVEDQTDLVCRMLPDGTITFVNQSCLKFFGKTLEQFIGSSIAERDIDGQSGMIKSSMAMLGPEMPIISFEEYLLLPDGSKRWVQWNEHAIIEDGKVIEIQAVGRDITARKQAEDKLIRSERQLSEAQSIARLGSWEWNILTNKAEWSSELYNIFGIPPESLAPNAYEGFLNLVHSLDRERFVHVMEQALATKEPFSVDYRIVRPDGIERYIHTRGRVISDRDGQAVQMHGSLQDITERRQADEVLRQSEEKYRTLVEQASDGIFVADADGKHIEVNSRGCEMLGYTRAEILQLKISDLLKSGEMRNTSLRLDALRQGKTLLTERTLVRKDGSTFPTEISVKMVAGGVLQAFVRDITERKRGEEILKKLSSVVEQATDLVFITDYDGVIEYVNPAFERLTGYTKDESIGQTPRILKSGKHTPVEYKQLWETIRAGKVLQGTVVNRKKNGELFYEEKIIAPLRDKQGSITHFVSTGRDITERKKTEEEIRLLLTITQAVGEAADFHSALGASLQRMCQASDWAFGEAWIPRPDNSSLMLGSAWHESGESLAKFKELSEGISFAPGIGLPGRVWSSKRPEWIRDVSINGKVFLRASPALEAGLRSGIGVPILADGQVLAVLVFFMTEVREADERLVEIISAIATQLGAVFQRKQSEEALHQRLGELEVLYQSSLALNQLLKPKEIAQNIIDLLDQKLAWHHTTIRLYHPQDETLELLAFNQPGLGSELEKRAVEERFKTSIAKKGQGLSGWVVEHGQSVRTHNLINDARYIETFPGLQSGLYVPIIIGERTIGVISIESEKADAFSEADERLVATLAAQAASALENARLFQETIRRLEHLQSLHKIDQAIAGSMDVSLILKAILNQVISQLGVDAAVILLYNPATNLLEYETGHGFRTQSLQHTRLSLGEGYAGLVALGRQTVQIPDLQTRNTDFLRSPTFSQEGFVSYFGVPLIAKGEIKGVLEIFYRTVFEAETEWLNFLETLAGQAAIAIDNATLFKGLQLSNIQLTMAYDATIDGWSHALDLRDKETEGHTQRVTEITMRLAQAMDISDTELVHIRRGALLHDIGKMGVPDGILFKPDKLTDEEWDIMKMHPQFAYDMLSPIAYLKPALDIPYCHHEKWDGTGYPQGLKGEQIPLAARIFAMVDVYDALTSDRPYREAWLKEKTLEYIRKQNGKHFDPQLVEVFLAVIGNPEAHKP